MRISTEKYRVQRNKVTSLVRKSKDEYYKRLTQNINTDHNKSFKSWWRLCKFLYTGKTNQHTIPHITTNDRVLTNDTDKAEAFNEYFTAISKVDNADSEPSENLNECISILEHIYITRQDVLDIIKSLKLNKACGFDLITNTLLKESVYTLSLPLSTLFNKSLSISRFLEKWKMANVTPIFKSKDSNILSNYRPISPLSCLGKAFERCVFEYPFNYLHEQKHISTYQSGFTPGDCTTNQLVSMYHEACAALENQNDIQLIFVDISKAFDKVWHNGFLFKLESVGIKHQLLQ